MTDKINEKQAIIKKQSTTLGLIVGNAKYQEGTVKVRVDYVLKNKKYNKTIKRHTNFLVQCDILDEKGNRKKIPLNTTVMIQKCQPISKRKNHRIVEVV